MKKRIMLQVTFLLLGLLMGGCVKQQNTETEQQIQKQEESQVASSDEMIEAIDVVEEGMFPIEGKSIKDGTYAIKVDSSSPMFKIEECILEVKNGQMTATMTMKGTGYRKVYMGTGEEAVKATENEFIYYVENEKKQHIYTVPVEALNKGIPCASFSARKEKWYNRVLLFRADSLPVEAISEELLTIAESLKLEDGFYTVDVELRGASGKTNVQSPAIMQVKDGQPFITITWNSSNYDYMKWNEERYEKFYAEGDSVFQIPVNIFDWNMPVIVNSVAMGEPRELSYIFYFDSASIRLDE